MKKYLFIFASIFITDTQLFAGDKIKELTHNLHVVTLVLLMLTLILGITGAISEKETNTKMEEMEKRIKALEKK